MESVKNPCQESGGHRDFATLWHWQRPSNNLNGNDPKSPWKDQDITHGFVPSTQTSTLWWHHLANPISHGYGRSYAPRLFAQRFDESNNGEQLTRWLKASKRWSCKLMVLAYWVFRIAEAHCFRSFSDSWLSCSSWPIWRSHSASITSQSMVANQNTTWNI